VPVAMTVSVAATLSGMAFLLAFNGTAGIETASPGLWPEGTALERSHTGQTMLVFAHPFCSCTGATLQELDAVLAPRRFRRKPPLVSILFARTDPAWRPGDLWRRAAKLTIASPGGSLRWDEGGSEARVFGVQTSGLVLLYDARGLLLFQGGITGSRGHVGNNYGAERLANALDSGLPPAGSWSEAAGSWSQVFGCALFGSRRLGAGSGM
jgi:hypothetical protein